PKSTRLVAADRVFVGGVPGRLRCLDAKSGAVHWRRDLAADYLGRTRNAEGHDLWAPICGVAASPLADRDRVILPVGGELAGAFARFYRGTGRVLSEALTAPPRDSPPGFPVPAPGGAALRLAR